MAKTRRGFYHWFSEITLPEQTTPEELLLLFPIVRNKEGEEQSEAKHRVIQGHLKLAMATVAEFAVRSPWKTDMMVSVALEALTDAVEMIAVGSIDHHKPEPNITGYIITTIRGKIRKYLVGDNIPKTAIFDLGKRILVTHSSKLEYNELVSKIVEDAREKEILDMALSGETDVAIAQKLGLSKVRIGQLRKKIGTKFLEQFK